MSTLYIRIYYGPVESFGVLPVHRPQFLNGLRDKLRKLGNRVDLIPVTHMNFCVLEICGYVVFRCNIRSLCFNIPCERDPVCMNAVDAVNIGKVKLQRARTYLWLWSLIYNQIFGRNDFSSKDYWLSDLPPLQEDEEFNECLNCCKVPQQVKTDQLNQNVERLLEQLKAD